MSRTALIADVHGNLEALQAVLEDIAHQDVDRIVCLGDLVGYGPDPARCIEVIHQVCDRIVIGNHDEAAAHPDLLGCFNPRARDSLIFTQAVISDNHINALARLTDRTKVDGVSFAHASFGPDQYEYLYDTTAAEASFNGLRTRIGVVGHTHVPSIALGTPVLGGGATNVSLRPLTEHILHELPNDQLTIINPGSVGQPRDRNPDAAWALLDTDAMTVRSRRVPYDIDATLAKINAKGLPDVLADRLRVGA